MKAVQSFFLSIAIAIAVVFSFSANAQVAINESGANADINAMLDISSNTKGLLIPRMDAAEVSILEGKTPETGMLIFNTNEGSIQYFDGTSFVSFYNSHTEFPEKVVFSAEYEGATLMADGSSNNGLMTADNTGSVDSWMNYYEWSSWETTLQDYHIVLRYTLPPGFKSFSTAAIQVDYIVSNAANASFCAYVYAEGSGTALASFTGGVSTSWTEITLATDVHLASLSGGDTFVIVLKPFSMNDATVKVGDVSINYSR